MVKSLIFLGGSMDAQQYAISWIEFLVGLFVIAANCLLILIARHLRLTSTSSILSQYHTRGSTIPERQLYLAFWEKNFNLIHDNTNDISKHITNTLRTYERIGLLVRKGGVNRHLVVYLIGDVGIRLWLILEKYIKEERDRRGDSFWHAGFEYLVMLSLKSHLRTSRGVVKIYHPDDRTKEKPYEKEKLIKRLQDIEVEMLLMPGGLGMSFGDRLSIFRHRPFLFFTWARKVFQNWKGQAR